MDKVSHGPVGEEYSYPGLRLLTRWCKRRVGVDRELGEAELVGSTLWEWIGKTQVFVDLRY